MAISSKPSYATKMTMPPATICRAPTQVAGAKAALLMLQIPATAKTERMAILKTTIHTSALPITWAPRTFKDVIKITTALIRTCLNKGCMEAENKLAP